MVDKGPNAFRTISEAATQIGVPQHVLRFWESKFTFVRPLKRTGGRRYYRPSDLTVLSAVRALLYDQGYKIEGVQKLYKDQGIKHLVAAGLPQTKLDALEGLFEPEGPPEANSKATAPSRARLTALLEELESAKRNLDAALSGRSD